MVTIYGGRSIVSDVDVLGIKVVWPVFLRSIIDRFNREGVGSII